VDENPLRVKCVSQRPSDDTLYFSVSVRRKTLSWVKNHLGFRLLTFFYLWFSSLRTFGFPCLLVGVACSCTHFRYQLIFGFILLAVRLLNLSRFLTSRGSFLSRVLGCWEYIRIDLRISYIGCCHLNFSRFLTSRSSFLNPFLGCWKYMRINLECVFPAHTRRVSFSTKPSVRAS